jgi:CDP-paratose 2-epimerase
MRALKGKTVLVTGGAGFVGSHLALSFKNHFGGDARVISLDNLKRRGSELNLPRLKRGGVEFVHGDIRQLEDIRAVGHVDLILECSAEPSVVAGYGSSPDYLLQTNLQGTVNCLEVARTTGADFVFLSTSRVYPIRYINDLVFDETETRFVLAKQNTTEGVSTKGISERLSLEGTRSLYGATKLCSELIIQEFIEMYSIRGVINRCAVLTGPWQMGKVDQGVVVLWAARHLFGGPLGYFGYGGTGKQVRDILHVDDLFKLLVLQYSDMDRHNGIVYNVGGGQEMSVSLCELTNLCRKYSGNTIAIDRVEETRVADIPYFITDNSKVEAATGWSPQIGRERVIEEIMEWLRNNENSLKNILT